MPEITIPCETHSLLLLFFFRLRNFEIKGIRFSMDSVVSRKISKTNKSFYRMFKIRDLFDEYSE